MKKEKPVFKVLYQEFNSGKIDFVNWFEFGQWTAIKKELLKIKRIFSKLQDSSVDDQRNALSKHFFGADKDYDPKKHNILEFAVNQKLRGECIYYFWSKCEYEILVKQWVGKEAETKLDVFEQLNANWDSFKKIVFEQIGI